MAEVSTPQEVDVPLSEGNEKQTLGKEVAAAEKEDGVREQVEPDQSSMGQETQDSSPAQTQDKIAHTQDNTTDDQTSLDKDSTSDTHETTTHTQDSTQDTEEGTTFRYMNRGGNFFTGVDTTSQEAAEKRAKRAARFGLEVNQQPSDETSVEKLQARAKRFGVKLVAMGDEPLRLVDRLPDIPDADLRPEAIHLHGTDEMSTQDIFGYFKLYAPRNVEWINDSSCNIVWEDAESAHRALHGLGEHPAALRSRFDDTQDEKMEEEEKPPSSTPAGEEERSLKIQWRLGVPHPKAKTLLLRHATVMDVKQRGAAKHSKYYLKYGNPNAPSRKRNDLRSRLGKRVADREGESQEEEDEEMEVDTSLVEDDPLSSLVKRPRPLHADQEEEEVEEGESDESDLRKRLKSQRKLKELKLRVGFTPRLVERTL